jgi:hypothetical protein
MAVLIRAPDLKTIVCYISPESTAIRGRFDATRLIPCTRAGNSKTRRTSLHNALFARALPGLFRLSLVPSPGSAGNLISHVLDL